MIDDTISRLKERCDQIVHAEITRLETELKASRLYRFLRWLRLL
jgi:hypothetical protein